MTITIYSPGEKAEALKHMANWAGNTKLSNERAIANGAVELDSGSQKIIDVFSDSDGANGTVDTGNTDTVYDSTDDYHFCDYSITGASTETAETTQAGTGSTSPKQGYAFLVSNNKYLNSITKHSSCTATKAYLYLKTGEDTGLLKSTATFSGDTATFTSGDCYLSTDNQYIIVVDNDGSTYTYTYNNTTVSYNYVNTNITFISHITYNGTSSTSIATNIISITVGDADYSDSTLQSDTVTIPTTDDYIFVTPYLAEELGDDALTFDYSMDNESNWETGKAINTWIDASGATNTGTMSIRLQLDTDDGSTTPKVKGWAVLTE